MIKAMAREQIINIEALPSSQLEARRQGLDRFFTGEPCKHGHLAARYASTKNCVACQVEHARRNGGWRARPPKAAYLNKARKFAEQRGGELLSLEYVAARAKLKVRCAADHEFEVTADNLKRGRWCPECKRQKQSTRLAQSFWSVERLREFARQRYGGDCLAIAPSPMLSKVPWKCTNGSHTPFEAVIAKVIHSGQWCPACWQERRRPPKPAILFDTLEEAVRQRGGEVFRVGKNGIWKGSKTRVTVRCANGHEWSADAANLLYAKSWCPDCRNKGERIVRAIFEATFGGQFPKSKPEWLLSIKGRKLELDGYNQQDQIAFEYQGPHHRSVDHVIAHDTIKRKACFKHGVRLIEIDAVKTPYPPEKVLQKVKEAFESYGITKRPVLPEGNIFAVELQELAVLARTRGGHLISDRYLGSEAHEWKCSVGEHPSWFAESWRIRKGAWCPSCAGNRRLGMEGLRSWGISVGLELFDTEYRGGAQTVYSWRCLKAGHIVRRSRSNVRQSISCGVGPCPVCAGTLRGGYQSSES